MRAAFAGLLFVSLLAAGCGNASTPRANKSPSTPKANPSAILRLGIVGTTGSLDPFTTLAGEYSTYTNIFPLLVTYNLNTLKFEPDFATSWTTSSNGMVWTFQTRPHAKWSDGQPLTANDAAFTLGTIAKFGNGPTSGYASYVSHLTSAVATGPDTLVLTYSQPVFNVLAQAGSVQILPQHIWSQYSTGSGKALVTFPNLPSAGQPTVSGGPFMLTQHSTNFEVFKRNPNYYGHNTLSGFDVQYYSSSDAMITALKSGQIDAVAGVPPTGAQTLNSAGIHVSTSPGVSYLGLTINTNPNITSHKELLNPSVRKAFEYAINRQQIAKVVYLGYAQPGNTIETPAMGRWYDNSIKPLPFDMATANQLLHAAGYKRGSDGVRVANGQPMSYQVLITSAQVLAFQILQADFKNIGVTLTAQTLDKKAQFAAISANHYQNFAMAITTGGPEALDPDYGLSTMICSAVTEGRSSTGYCNPAYDALYSKQGTEHGSQRVQTIDQMQQIVHSGRPVIPLVYVDNIDAWSKSWSGFRETPDGIFTFLSPLTLTQVHDGG
ncbi:MAG: ABC transporter substrate-binding protein [Acidimicrobiales bacterium]